MQDLDTEPDSQGDESEAMSVRTLRRGDCCLVSSEGERPNLAVVLRTFLKVCQRASTPAPPACDEMFHSREVSTCVASLEHVLTAMQQ